MIEIVSTRLRTYYGKSIESITEAIEALPFKVEMKQIVACPWDKNWYVTFVIPEASTTNITPFLIKIT